MMTSAQFKKRSNIFLHRRKSSIIQDIDKLLKEYEKSTSENRKMKCLVYIYLMCKQYVHGKPNGRRGDAVRDLMGEVRAVLDSPAFKREISAKAGGRHYSGGKATDKMSTSGATATSLAQGYTWEGILPQKNFVSKMHLNMDTILGSDQKYFGASLISESFEQSTGMSASQVNQMIAAMPFSQILDRVHVMWTDKSGLTGSFNYLNAGQRVQYLLTIKNGLLYWNRDGAVFDSGTTWGGGSLPAMFVMDNDERLFSLGDAKGVGVNWNHSSLLSGQPVICAGELEVKQGQLASINNNSGHYKPDSQNLADCVRILSHAGLNVQNFMVDDKKRKQVYPTGAAFLAANP